MECDESVNILTTVVNESFIEFVEGYQKEFTEDTGIKFGFLAIESFNTITTGTNENNEPIYLGQEQSEKLFQHFLEKEYIDKKGKILDSLKVAVKGNTVDLGQEFEADVTKQIINRIKKVVGSLEIKNNAEKVDVKLKKKVYLSEDFKNLWDSIKYKTVYKVDFDSDQLIQKCIKSLNDNIHNEQAKIEHTKAKLAIKESGVKADGEVKNYVEHLNIQVSHLPDIITYLQNETDLTRKSIIKLLKGLETRVINYFKSNPQAFIESCIGVINMQKRLFIVDGIKYEKIDENTYYDQKMIEEEDLVGYLSKYMVESTKSVFENTLCDSEVEVNLANEFENSDNVSLYTKLPNWFKVPTPLGTYNPDWAIMYNKGNGDQLYFITESKGTTFDELLRPIEKGKIDCGKVHFNSIGSRMIVAHTMEDIDNNV